MRATIRVRWENAATAALTLERKTPSGRMSSRALGPRAILRLEEAAAAVERPRDQVRRAIRAGFLRARRRGGRTVVTVQACADFLREERADREVVRARRGAPTVPFEEVLRELGD